MLDNASVEHLRETIWKLTGLMRVYLRDGEHPIALHPPPRFSTSRTPFTTTSVRAARVRESGALRRASTARRSAVRTCCWTVTLWKSWTRSRRGGWPRPGEPTASPAGQRA